ncbi:MAG: MmgE/PrpD family protein [Acidimicrobiaceae bacterium]|nr:MmgE/PrpD family protein [Acidimicrobiaceae bacterium]
MSTDVAVHPITRELAEFGSSLRYEDIPADVVAMAKRCILDSLACGVYGAATPWTDAVREVVGALGQDSRATAWGTRFRADPTGVALINGTSAQGFELDDCHDQSMSHYGASVVPAVLAMSEWLGGVDGQQLILATVVGYELGTRIGNAVSPGVFMRGFHPCGLTGTFAAAAAVAKLTSLDTEKFVNALGLAGSQAAGLMASQYGAMAKRFHSGKAAQNGILSALSARAGLTGVRDVLEAPYGGFCSSYSDEYDLELAVTELGKDFEILRNGFKQYSSLASSHTSVDAIRELAAKHKFEADDVEGVLVETTEVVFRHCGWPYVPAETITAQMNLPYTAAVTLLDGIAFVDQYADDRLRDPKVLALAEKVSVVVDPELDALGPDEMRAVRVTISTKAGDRHATQVLYRSGHYKNPLTDEALVSKFRDLAGRTLTEEAVERIIEIVSGLDGQANPAALIGERVQQLRD